ncbi:recombinase family protein [Chloroflexota bacterium]
MKATWKPAAIWTRVSTSGQAETSLPSQVSRCEAKAKELGYVVTRTFTVDHSSMDLFNSPDFQELRKAIRAREIAGVIVFDRDRLEAKGLQRLVFLSECKEAGVESVICQGPPILDAPEGQLVELALAIGKERQVLRARQGAIDGLKDRAEKYRKPVNMKKSYGYDWQVDGQTYRLIPNENWDNVKLIFDMALKGSTIGAIIRELFRKAIPTPKGMMEKWAKSTINGILKNPVYAGRYYALKKQAVEPVKRRVTKSGKTSRIVKSLEEACYLPEVQVVNPPISWTERQVIMKVMDQNKLTARRNAQKNDYLLRGRIFCETHKGKQGKPRVYFGQPHPSRKGGVRYECPVGGCRHPTLDGTQLELLVKDIIKDILEAPFHNSGLLIKLMGTQHKQATEASLLTEQQKLDKRRTASVNKEAKLVDDHYSGKIGDEVYNKLISQYQGEKQYCEKRLQEILDQLKQLSRQDEALGSIADIRSRYWNETYKKLKEMSIEDYRQLLTLLNLAIYVKAEQPPEDSYDKDINKLTSQELSDADFLKHKRKMERKYYSVSTYDNIPFDSLRFELGIPLTDENMTRIVNATPSCD